VPRAARIAVAVAVGLVALLALGQVILPGIAERRLRDSLETRGQVEEVSISAFPAIKLLWHRADDVTVRMGALDPAPPGDFADLLARTVETTDLDASAREQQILTLRLHDSSLRKRGDELTLSSTVDDADLRAALPPGFDVRPVASGDGALVFEGSADLFGQRFQGRAVVAARDGRLLLTPDLPFGGFLSLTLFADPRIEVLSVGARQRPGGFTLAARARVR
jgi:hypothetical protein